MLKLPFHIVSDALENPNPMLIGLSRAWKPFKPEVKSLRNLNKVQTTAMKLVLMAETEWMTLYLSAIVESDKASSLLAHRNFLTEYYHGLVRICSAHAYLLTEEVSACENLAPMHRLQRSLNGKAELLALTSEYAVSEVTPSLYGELSRWAYVGTSLFFNKLETADSLPIEPNFPFASATQAAYKDYVAHHLGENLLSAKHLDRPSLITCLTAVPESLWLKS